MSLQERPRKPVVDATPSERGCVLVVEDDPVIREMVADLLEGEGYDVARASGGASALRWLEQRQNAGARQPDVILLDMRMPVLDGWGFAAAYRQTADPRSRIVVFPAAADAAACAAEIAADGVVAKPFEVEQLLAAIEACVQRRP